MFRLIYEVLFWTPVYRFRYTWASRGHRRRKVTQELFFPSTHRLRCCKCISREEAFSRPIPPSSTCESDSGRHYYTSTRTKYSVLIRIIIAFREESCLCDFTDILTHPRSRCKVPVTYAQDTAEPPGQRCCGRVCMPVSVCVSACVVCSSHLIYSGHCNDNTVVYTFRYNNKCWVHQPGSHRRSHTVGFLAIHLRLRRCFCLYLWRGEGLSRPFPSPTFVPNSDSVYS